MENKGIAFYDVPGTGWLRDIWVLLHWPYSLWHLSYVVIGAALAPGMRWSLLGWTILAFTLGMVVAGHIWDELYGRPLKTRIPGKILGIVGAISIAGAICIGFSIGLRETIWVLPCIFFGAIITFAYNLEWGPGGFFHRDEFFGLAWGAFPVITAYIAQAHTLTYPAALLALFAYLSSMAQRKLSLQSRFWRRKVTFINGYYQAGQYRQEPITRETIIAPIDRGLKYFNAAIVTLAVGMLVYRLLGG